jgi:hypothetical protein
MALTKTANTTIDDWFEINQDSVREGATYDVSDCYSSALHIDIALSSETAHAGTKIDIQISSNTTGDEDWTALVSFIGPDGTAISEALSGAEAIGQTVLGVALTSGFEAEGAKWIFLEDVNTVANSEMLYLVSFVTDTSITVLDGLTIAKDTADILFNIAENYVIDIPMIANRVRVIYDNTYDSDGSTVHTKCRISKVTGV